MWKHFSILWSGKKKSVNIECFYLFLIFFISVSCMGAGTLFAKDQATPVEMTVLSEEEVYTHSFQVRLKIRFLDAAYYNDDLYASYHLMDSDSGAVILFENPRIKVPKPSAEGFSEVETDVSLEEFDKDQKLTVQFDIVDQRNAFWFSDKMENMHMPEVRYVNDRWKEILAGLKKEILDAPVIFGINMITACIFIVIAGMVKRKRII